MVEDKPFLISCFQIGPDDPRYKQSFHAMSPEEAGISVSETQSPPPESTSGKKRRRVEQIVQNLQNSLSTSQQPA
jgi:hypothetical protein